MFRQLPVWYAVTMFKAWPMKVTTTAAFLFAVSSANVLAGYANAANAVEKEAPTQVVLLPLETKGYEAWKSKDAKFWETFLANKFVGWGSSGRLDKASASKEYTGADCKIESFAISDVQVSQLGEDAALITHKITVNGACGGQQEPNASWAATAYVRDGGQWKAAFHAQAAITSPASPLKPFGQKADLEKKAKPADGDALTDTLLTLEQAIWAAWKDHNARKLDDLTAKNVQFINIFGTHLASKAEALKNWSGEGCDVKTVGLTDAAATMLSSTVGILTFHASADGTCFGQKVGPVWGSSIYVKDGDTWKWNFGINLPAVGEP